MRADKLSRANVRVGARYRGIRIARKPSPAQRRPGGLHERAPTRQCQPIFLPWLQPGGLKPGSRTSARECRAVREWMVAVLDARALKLDPTPTPVPIPIIGRASVAPAAASGKPTAAVKTSRYLRMISLLYWAHLFSERSKYA